MIGVTVCGNIIPFIYHVLGTNAIIKGFMQYVVVVCFIRAACLVVIISAAGIKGEFVGSIKSEFLIDSICIESCRSYFPGFFQLMSFGVLFVWIQLPSLGLLTAVRGVGAELAGIDICVYGLGKTSFTGITGIAGNIDSIFCIISNNVDYSSDSICSVKSGRGTVQYFNTFDFGNIDSGVSIISIQAFAIFQKNEIIIRQSIQTQCCTHTVGHT